MFRSLTFVILAFAAGTTLAATQSFDARVIGVSDGDTVTVLDSNHLQYKIRLAGTDALEKGEPFGEKSKQNLARMVMGQDVRIEWDKRDRYGRIVGKIWATPMSHPCTTRGEPCPRTLDVGRAQLTVGFAWHFKKYEMVQSEEDRLAYAFDEQEARVRKAGLWSDPDPVSPGEWRAGPKDGPVKKSRNDICHAPASPNYQSVKNFAAYPTLDTCLASGGRLQKSPKN